MPPCKRTRNINANVSHLEYLKKAQHILQSVTHCLTFLNVSFSVEKSEWSKGKTFMFEDSMNKSTMTFCETMYVFRETADKTTVSGWDQLMMS